MKDCIIMPAVSERLTIGEMPDPMLARRRSENNKW